MLYLFYGDDAPQAKQKISKLVETLLQKKQGALHIHFDDQNFNQEFLKSLFGSVGLFAQHHVIVLDQIFSLADEDHIAAMKDSPHVFLMYEKKLVKKELELVEKLAEKRIECQTTKKVGQPKANIFPLLDAIGARNKKRAWTLYRQLINEGVVAEEIQPLVCWQIKTMLACYGARNATEAGVKPFVFTKAKKSIEKYDIDTLKQYSREVIDTLHKDRTGKGSIENLLEIFLLQL